MTDNLGEYERWLLARGLSSNTIDQRMKFARARWREWRTWSVPPDQVAAFLSQHHGWTRRTYQNHATSLFDWLVDEGVVEANPCARIRKAPTPRCHPRPLTTREVAVVMTHAEGDLLTFLQLARLAGLRRHEIAKFRGQDITEHVVYVLGKGGLVAELPTHPELWRIAQNYPRRGYWFPADNALGHVSEQAVSSRARRLFARHGIAKAIHRLRANYATDLLRAGVNIKVVQSLMRHSSLVSTEHYLADVEAERVAAIGLLAA